MAKVRLADEYDKAQEAGEVARNGGDRISTSVANDDTAPTVNDVGFTRQEIHQARQIRDAEKAEPESVSLPTPQNGQAASLS